MGAYNTLYNPKGNMVINAFRGRFLLPSGLIKSKSDIGDVNNDGEVTVSDVALMVNRILGEEIGSFDASVADINNDNEITVSDVMAVVSIILGNMDFKVVTNMEDASISFHGDGFGPARAGENLIWDEYE